MTLYDPKDVDQFLPHGGSHFDDLRPATAPPTEAELNSLAIRTELNQRDGVAIFVDSNEQRVEMQKVVKYWRLREELHHPVPVLVDTTIRPGGMQIRRP